MRDHVIVLFALMAFGLRALNVRKLWRAPLRHGEAWFLAQPVSPGFHHGPGASLLARYRTSLLASLLADAPLAIALYVSGRLVGLLYEQFAAWLLATVLVNVLLVHYSYRAATAVGDAGEPAPTAVRLSMEPRRLRDHSSLLLELVVWGAMAASVALIVTHHAFRLGKVALLVLYFQVGLLLLKLVWVRWRKPLPRQRVEDFLRWRAAWLRTHLRMFDGMRLAFALAFLALVARQAAEPRWSPGLTAAAFAAWAVVCAAVVVDASREQRRLAALERELKPIELVREFPRKAVAEGRFFGRVLFWNRENPAVLVRGPDGVALNLAHPSTYAWVAWFVGLVLLLAWLARPFRT